MARQRATGVHKIHSTFSVSGGVLSFYRDNASTQVAYGEDGTGLDVKFFGDTASAYVLWDESTDTLEGASGATLNWDGAAGFAGTASFAGVAAFTASTSFAAPVTITASKTSIGDASTDKIGFFGATPVVQGVHTATSAIASTIAINVLEFLQTIGLMTATV